MRILVTGGCGYVGTKLVQALLHRTSHEIVVVDTGWFGDFLTPHPRLVKHLIDMRATDDIPVEGVDVIYHLANIANDPSVDLDPTLSWEVNCLATMRLLDRAVRTGAKQFVYASSGSVYGVKEEPEVTEDLPLTPISVYNKTKMVAERVVLSYSDQLAVQVVRPATVCGLSPRMRLDLSVNILTFQALSRGVITVFGGDQTRPNIHIDDLVDVYLFLLENGRALTGVYNAGFENISILDIARLVTSKIPAEIKISDSNDPRSYRLSSQKLLKAGFQPKRTVEDAVNEIVSAYRAGTLQDDQRSYNVNWMKKLIAENSL